jgi:hypothetical protein
MKSQKIPICGPKLASPNFKVGASPIPSPAAHAPRVLQDRERALPRAEEVVPVAELAELVVDLPAGGSAIACPSPLDVLKDTYNRSRY